MWGGVKCESEMVNELRTATDACVCCLVLSVTVDSFVLRSDYCGRACVCLCLGVLFFFNLFFCSLFYFFLILIN